MHPFCDILIADTVHGKVNLHQLNGISVFCDDGKCGQSNHSIKHYHVTTNQNPSKPFIDMVVDIKIRCYSIDVPCSSKYL